MFSLVNTAIFAPLPFDESERLVRVFRRSPEGGEGEPFSYLDYLEYRDRKVMSEMIRVCRPGGRIVMLNHFSNGNKLIAAVERVISPLCKHIGFRTDLSLNHVLEGTSLQVMRKEKVNPLRFWHLVECINQKDGEELEVLTEPIPSPVY